MKQKVHSVSYLAKAEFELKDGTYDLVALPSGAEVVKVSLEVVGNPNTGIVGVGIKDESVIYFLSLELGAAADKKNITSVKDYTATSNKVVTALVRDTGEHNYSRCVLRVLYFLPSVIEVEY
ncbi:hypothetical protein VN0835_11720 [Helicobacter pylori]